MVPAERRGAVLDEFERRVDARITARGGFPVTSGATVHLCG